MRAAVTVVGLIALCGGLSGCGDDDAADEAKPEDAVVAYLDAVNARDVAAAWESIPPAHRTEIAEADWAACLSGRLVGLEGLVLEYTHDQTTTEGDRTLVEGTLTVSSDGEPQVRPVVLEVTEDDGEWFYLGEVDAPDPTCYEEIRAGG